MNNLTNNQLLLIFKKLDILSLLRCRLVNNEWKQLIDSSDLEIKQLIITNGEKFRLKKDDYQLRWFNNKDDIEINNLLQLNLSNLKEFQIFKFMILNLNFFKNLNQLKLMYRLTNENYSILSHHLLKFENLHELNIHIICKLNLNLILKHPTLKVIYLDVLIYSSEFKFQCPQLTSLHRNLTKSECKSIKNKQKIRHLSGINLINPYTSINLLQFKNLESIQFEKVQWFDLKKLFKLNKLKLIIFEKLPLENKLKEFLIKKASLEREIVVCYKDKKILNLDDLIFVYTEEDLEWSNFRNTNRGN